MCIEQTGFAFPAELGELFDPSLVKLMEMPLHGSASDARELGDLLVSKPLRFQPNHFHLLLNPWVWVMKAFVVKLFENLRRKLVVSHGCSSLERLFSLCYSSNLNGQRQRDDFDRSEYKQFFEVGLDFRFGGPTAIVFGTKNASQRSEESFSPLFFC